MREDVLRFGFRVQGLGPGSGGEGLCLRCRASRPCPRGCAATRRSFLPSPRPRCRAGSWAQEMREGKRREGERARAGGRAGGQAGEGSGASVGSCQVVEAVTCNVCQGRGMRDAAPNKGARTEEEGEGERRAGRGTDRAGAAREGGREGGREAVRPRGERHWWAGTGTRGGGVGSGGPGC